MHRSHLGDAGLARIPGEAERILLGCYLGADELARQLAERDTGGFEVVHRVHVEHTAAVKVALDRFVGERYIALDVAFVAGIVAQTLHGQHRDDQLVGIRALAYQIGIAVQIGGQRGQLIGFVEQRHKLLRESDCIRHKSLLLLSRQPERCTQRIRAGCGTAAAAALVAIGVLSSFSGRNAFGSVS